MESIGQSIRRMRKECGLTQSQLATYSGTSTKFINQLESGKISLKLDKVLDVLAVFDCTICATKIGKEGTE